MKFPLEEELTKNVLNKLQLQIYNDEDFDTFVLYLMENWKLGYEEGNISAKLAAEIYAHYTLAECQVMITDKTFGGFAGFETDLLDYKTESQIYHKLRYEQLLKEHPQMNDYYNSEDKIEEVQKSNSHNYLQMLIVGKEFQGLKLGKRLFEAIIDVEKYIGTINNSEEDFQELSVYTTTDCNVSFYNKMKSGTVIYREESVPDGDEPSEALIFLYDLKNY